MINKNESTNKQLTKQTHKIINIEKITTKTNIDIT